MQMVYQEYKAKFFPWSSIEACLSRSLTSALNREIKCKIKVEAGDFWSVKLVRDRLSVREIGLLLDRYHASEECRTENLPEESDSSAYIGMRLSELILKNALSLDWKRYFFDRDGIWMIGGTKHEE